MSFRNVALAASILHRDINRRWVVLGVASRSPELLKQLVSHYTAAAQRAFRDDLLSVGVTGSASQDFASAGDVDLLMVVRGDWSLRARGHYKGVDVDVFIEGDEALRRDLESGYSSLHVNLLAHCVPFVDPSGILAEFANRGRMSRSMQRPVGIVGLREMFAPHDVLRKLMQTDDMIEFSYIAARLVEVCLVTYLERTQHWLVGHAKLLQYIKDINCDLHSTACNLLTAEYPITERKRCAQALVECSTGRLISSPKMAASGVEYRHHHRPVSVIGRA